MTVLRSGTSAELLLIISYQTLPASVEQSSWWSGQKVVGELLVAMEALQIPRGSDGFVACRGERCEEVGTSWNRGNPTST